MAVPGTSIVQRDAAAPRTLPTDTGVAFIVGKAASGPKNEPTPVQSLAAYSKTFGSRTGAEVLYDSVDAFFRYGGRKAFIVNVDDAGDGLADSDYIAALASIERDLGPGQVILPGVVSTTVQTAALEHAANNNRVAILDLDDAPASEVVADLAVLASSQYAKHGAAFGPWAVIPGLAGGTTRTVPYSAVQAALIARNDALNGPHSPAAGVRGSAPILGLSQEYTEEDREAIHEAGGNVVRFRANEFRTYGYQTLADRDANPLHWQLSQVRLDMAISARAEDVGERFLFSAIDGQGIALSQYGAELAAMLMEFYTAGALYGATPDEAFRVETGPTVNTPETLARGELRAVLSIRRSPFAERVVIEIVKTAITEAL